MNQIYLDNQSTTPPDPKVIEEMSQFYREKFGNASSIDHSRGWEAKEALSHSRAKIGRLIGSQPEQIILTSGATESINLALRGLAKRSDRHPQKIITFRTEHRAVLDTSEAVSNDGLDAVYLGVDKDGYIDLDELQENIDEKTLIVSVLHANNEIGVVQDIDAISDIANKKGVALHIDASQSIGKIPLDVSRLGRCMISFTSHKIYGPQGIGALYINSELKNQIAPQITGGGHEHGARSGTTPIALAAGFGKACEIASDLIDDEIKRINTLTSLLESNLRTIFPELEINGPSTDRVAGNINVKIPRINNRAFIMKVPEIQISRGSACTSSNEKRSHVLEAIGLSKNEIDSSLRFGVGRFNSEEEINQASEIIKSRFGG